MVQSEWTWNVIGSTENVKTIQTEPVEFCYHKSGICLSRADSGSRAVIGSSLAQIGGSNPAGSMDVCLLWVLCVVS
jgi:hypothetical protein